ncbi:MAG: nucleotide pyrophosphatase/phosphodiesterase family protein [Victivallales bacterium]
MKLLVIQVAALGYDLWQKHARAGFWKKLKTRNIRTVFPALTCPVQASFRTALPPEKHGMIANGVFDRKLCKAFFWEQSSSLYEGKRIWDKFRSDGGTVGQICWQQSIGADSDLIVSPAPIHKHHGGMIQDFYSEPDGIYSSLCNKIGCKFNLHSYWGPFTSISSTRWIASAASELLVSNDSTDMLLVYLPHLDYDLQKYGPSSRKVENSFAQVETEIERLFVSAKLAGYEVLLFGDYAITHAEQPIYPNRILWDAGYFTERNVSGRLYPDLYTSKAFAMVDHQVAHIYLKDANDLDKVAGIFENVSGVLRILTRKEMNHERCGDLIIEAAAGCWFAYPWWEKASQAPDYAGHIDIHNKPGFDPCELFMSLWPPMSISQDATRIRGTHGASYRPEHDVLCATTFALDEKVTSITAAAAMVESILK